MTGNTKERRKRKSNIRHLRIEYLFQEENNMSYENSAVMKEFTEVLKKEPDKAYDFICCNADKFSKDGLLNILKELLYSLYHNINCSFYKDAYKDILEDTQIELDEIYEEDYKELTDWLEALRSGKLHKFYFTFGSSSQFPYPNRYLVVIAESLKDAKTKFRSKHPDKTPGIYNFSDVYTEEQWKEAQMEGYYLEEPAEIIE